MNGSGIFPVNFLKTVEIIQAHLDTYYGNSGSPLTASHLIRSNQIESLIPEISNQISNNRGSLLCVHEQDELFVGVHFSDEIIETIEVTECFQNLTQENLDAFCVVVEEISHFRLMMDRASIQLEVSQLELEWQGEIDKLLISASLLNFQHENPHWHELFSIIFETSSFSDSPDLIRYQEANHHAAKFWSTLLNQFHEPFHRSQIEHVKDLLRSGYRSNWQGKLALLNRMDSIAA